MLSLYLSKLLSFFITPLGFSLICIVTGIFLSVYRGSSNGNRLIVAGTVCIWLFSTPLFSDFITASLERQFLAKNVEEYPKVDAILVLGGSISGPIPPRKYLDMSNAADRVLHAWRLYNAGKANKIILSGGGITFLGTVTSEASITRGLLIDWGVPDAAIILEEKSRTTYENGVESKKIINENSFQRILLVTSAAHMPRAYKVFKSQEFLVIPAPTDYLIIDNSVNSIFKLLPTSGALELSTNSVKEYMGIFVYWILGKI